MSGDRTTLSPLLAADIDIILAPVKAEFYINLDVRKEYLFILVRKAAAILSGTYKITYNGSAEHIALFQDWVKHLYGGGTAESVPVYLARFTRMEAMKCLQERLT